MVSLSYLVEGLTEKNFIKHILNPHLKTHFNIAVNDAQETGGEVRLERLVDMLNLLLSREEQIGGYVTMLFDYYGNQWNSCHPNSPDDVLAYLKKTVNHPERFIPYVQKYEIESLWFSEVEVITNCVGFPESHLAQLKAIVTKHNDNPESINGGMDTHPSKRLQSIFGRKYNKVLHGEQIAKAIGIRTMKAKCPRFAEWVTHLEALGQQ